MIRCLLWKATLEAVFEASPSSALKARINVLPCDSGRCVWDNVFLIDLIDWNWPFNFSNGTFCMLVVPCDIYECLGVEGESIIIRLNKFGRKRIKLI